MPALQAGDAGSNPARVMSWHNEKETATEWWNGRHATLRTSCPRGVGVRLSPRSFEIRHRGWASAQRGLISLDRRVRHPNPLLFRQNQAGYANGKSGEVESLVILWVRLPPRSLKNGNDCAESLADANPVVGTHNMATGEKNCPDGVTDSIEPFEGFGPGSNPGWDIDGTPRQMTPRVWWPA